MATEIKVPHKLVGASTDDMVVDADYVGNMPVKFNSNGLGGIEESDGTASGKKSHAEGGGKATGVKSHAEGGLSTASGAYSHAEGMGTASGMASHAEGISTEANAENAHAEGNNTIASGVDSHAEGFGTKALNQAEHAEGWYNESTSGKTIHSVGIGSREIVDGSLVEHRKNAEEITTDGKRYLLNVGGYDGTNVSDDDVQDEASYLNSLAREMLISNEEGEEIEDIDTTLQDKVDELAQEISEMTSVKIVKCTTAEYDALVDAGTVKADTYYFITDGTITTE